MSSPTNYQQKLTGIAKIESNIHIRARRALTDRDVAFQTKSTGVTPPDPERWGVYIIRPILRKQRPKYDYRCRVNAELQSNYLHLFMWLAPKCTAEQPRPLHSLVQ